MTHAVCVVSPRGQGASTEEPDWLPTCYGGSAERHEELMLLRDGSAAASPMAAYKTPPAPDALPPAALPPPCQRTMRP